MGFEPIREEEGSFFKNNKIATPARVTNFVNQGGKSQPTLDKEWMTGDTGMGKQTSDRDPNIAAYNENSVNVS